MIEAHPLGTWAKDIEALTPHAERLAWLAVRWNPRCERALVYQLLPVFATPLLVCEDTQPLKKHPKVGCWMPDPAVRLHLMKDMVDSVSWQLFEETGRYSRSYWVVQGSHGGHKRRFSNVERQLARLRGLELDPPKPGDLPFAPVDGRVFQKLLPYDQVTAWEYAFGVDERTPAFFEAKEKEALKDIKGQYWAWLESQVDDALEAMGRKMPLSDLPLRRVDGPHPDFDAIKDRLIS